MNFQKIVVYLGLLLDIIGIAILIPAFPELKVYYGINDLQVTLWLTIYSICAFVAAPVLGQLSDKYGRKSLLAWCIWGTIISYVILLVTRQYRIFLLSRMINGITGGNISILQAILTDISPDEKTKSKNFWLMWAFFGLWFIIGPLLWSLLLKFFSVDWIFRFGALFGGIELLLIWLYFKNTNPLQHEKHISFNTFHIMRKYLRKETMRNFLISFFFLGVWWFIINISLSLFMNGKFGTSGEVYGYLLSISWLISAFNMAFLIPRFWTKYLSHKQLIIWTHIALIVWYGILGFIQWYTAFILVFYIVIILSGIYMPIYNIQIMSQAKPNEIGELSGMLGGAQSLFMFFWPLFWGLLLMAHRNIFRSAVVFFIVSGLIMLKRLVTSTSQ